MYFCFHNFSNCDITPKTQFDCIGYSSSCLCILQSVGLQNKYFHHNFYHGLHSLYWFVYTLLNSLLQISGFVLNEKFQRNASKITIFYIHVNPKLLFPSFILFYFIFFPNEWAGLCRHRPGHSSGEYIM